MHLNYGRYNGKDKCGCSVVWSITQGALFLLKKEKVFHPKKKKTKTCETPLQEWMKKVEAAVV